MKKKVGEGSVVTLTVPETAEYLRIGLSAAYAAAKAKEIPTIRIGRRILVPKAALDKKLEAAESAA
jgi:excisionase family DNA binding protein